MCIACMLVLLLFHICILDRGHVYMGHVYTPTEHVGSGNASALQMVLAIYSLPSCV
jgi:hypothetical protein